MEKQIFGIEYAKKLAEKLKEYAEWAEANQWEVPIALPDDLADAASIIQDLADVILEGKTCLTCSYYEGCSTPICATCDEDNCNWEWKGVNVRV